MSKANQKNAPHATERIPFDDALAAWQPRRITDGRLVASLMDHEPAVRGTGEILLAARTATPSVTKPAAPAASTLRRLDAVATENGFPSTPAFAKWCERRGVTIHTDHGKLRWVDPAQVEQAKSTAVKPPRAPEPREPRRNRDADEIARGKLSIGRRR